MWYDALWNAYHFLTWTLLHNTYTDPDIFKNFAFSWLHVFSPKHSVFFLISRIYKMQTLLNLSPIHVLKFSGNDFGRSSFLSSQLYIKTLVSANYAFSSKEEREREPLCEVLALKAEIRHLTLRGVPCVLAGSSGFSRQYYNGFIHAARACVLSVCERAEWTDPQSQTTPLRFGSISSVWDFGCRALVPRDRQNHLASLNNITTSFPPCIRIREYNCFGRLAYTYRFNN